MSPSTRARIGIAMFGIGVILAPAVYDAATQAAGAARARQVLASLSGSDVSHLAVEWDRGSMILRHIEVEAPGAHISVGRATLRRSGTDGIAVFGTAAAATSAVTLDDVKIAIRKAVILIPHLEAKGSPLNGAELAGIFDSQSSDTLPERLSRLSAAELTAAEVILTRAPDAGGTDKAATLTFHDVALDDLTAGHIGALAIRQITADGSDLMGSTGAVTASRIDLPQIISIARETRSDRAQPMRPLIGGFSLQGADVKVPDTEMKLASFKIGTVQGRPPLASFADIDALSNKPAAERSAAEEARLSEALGDLARSFAVDRIAADDLGFQATKDAVSFGFGTLLIEGLEPGKVKLATVERFSLSTVPSDMAFGRLTLEGYDQTPLLNSLSQGSLATAPDDLKKQVAHAAPTFAGIALLGMRIDAQSDDLKGNVRQGRRTVIDVPVADLKLNRTADAGTISAAHAQVIYDIAPDVSDPGLQKLLQTGFAHFDVSLDYGSTWSQAARTLSLDRMALAGQGLGSVALSGAFANVAPELFDPAQADRAESLAPDVEVRSVRMDVVDAGLAAKVWSMAAAGAGVSVPLLKAEAKGQVQAAMVQIFGDTPTATRVTKAASAFIDDPKTLTLSAKAPAGMSFRAISETSDPQELFSRLDIGAEAGP